MTLKRSTPNKSIGKNGKLCPAHERAERTEYLSPAHFSLTRLGRLKAHGQNNGSGGSTLDRDSIAHYRFSLDERIDPRWHTPGRPLPIQAAYARWNYLYGKGCV